MCTLNCNSQWECSPCITCGTSGLRTPWCPWRSSCRCHAISMIALHFTDKKVDHAVNNQLRKWRLVIDILDQQLWIIFLSQQDDFCGWEPLGFQWVPLGTLVCTEQAAHRSLKVYILGVTDQWPVTAPPALSTGGRTAGSMQVVVDLMEKGGAIDKEVQEHTDNWYLSLRLFHNL